METSPGATLYSDLIRAQYSGFNLAQVDFGPGPDNIFNLPVGTVNLGELIKVNYQFQWIKLVAAEFVGMAIQRLAGSTAQFSHVGYNFFNVRRSWCDPGTQDIIGGTVWLNVVTAGTLALQVVGQSNNNQARTAVGQTRLYVDIIRAV